MASAESHSHCSDIDENSVDEVVQSQQPTLVDDNSSSEEVDEIIKPKGLTSEVWKYFGFKRGSTAATATQSFCTICHIPMTYSTSSSTTNMRYHLEKKHDILLSKGSSSYKTNKRSAVSGQDTSNIKKQFTLAECLDKRRPWSKDSSK